MQLLGSRLVDLNMNYKILKVLLLLFVTALAIQTCRAQQPPEVSPKILFKKWEDWGSRNLMLDKSLTWHLESANNFLVKSGIHHLCRVDENLSWYVGEEPTKAILAKARNASYSFVLGRPDLDSVLTIKSLSEKKPLAGAFSDEHFLFPSAGGVYGFFCLPVIGYRLNTLGPLADFISFQEQRVLENGTIYLDFIIQQDKLRETLAKGESNSILQKASAFGFQKGHWIIDAKTYLPLEFYGEFESSRDPISVELIQAANRAGQRKPDGSEYSEDMAEAPGQSVTEKQAFRCNWEYRIEETESIISRFTFCNEPNFDSFGVDFVVTNIVHSELSPDIFRLKAFGLREPEEHAPKTEEGNEQSFSPLLKKALPIIAAVSFLTVYLIRPQVNEHGH